jgi:hypothetical protein
VLSLWEWFSGNVTVRKIARETNYELFPFEISLGFIIAF